ncbi:MAG TPA: cysteine desulfurase [Candidatus Acidoferrales bacterium]|nr:cysteine desulfurase [Candidatus Acidoferrales bacterium]
MAQRSNYDLNFNSEDRLYEKYMYDIYSIRRDFPVLNEVIYLDNAATSQTPRQSVEAMNEFFFTYAANYGRGAHRLARKTTEQFEIAREVVANFFNAKAEKVIFTKNTTEGINIVANGLEWFSGDRIITSVIEHHSNYLPWIALRKYGVKLDLIESDREGIIDPKNIEDAITERTKLIAISHISNVFGSVQDIMKIVKIGHKNDVKVLIDAAQSAGHSELSFREIGCDFLAMPGHKGLLGPQGTGVLIADDPASLAPSVLGGGAVESVRGCEYELLEPPNRFEAGTPNIPGVIGLGRSVEYVQDLGLMNIHNHVNMISRLAAKDLSDIQGVKVYGPPDRAGLVSFNVGELNPHDVSLILDETNKICTRSGYHCAMPALQFLDVQGTVRASFGPYNTIEEVDVLVESVNQLATTFF